MGEPSYEFLKEKPRLTGRRGSPPQWRFLSNLSEMVVVGVEMEIQAE
jgi:hypothetical protein